MSTKTRKRLKSFTLDEISMVDSPAQKGATFRLVKRDTTTGLPLHVQAKVERVLKLHTARQEALANQLARITKTAGVEMDDEEAKFYASLDTTDRATYDALPAEAKAAWRAARTQKNPQPDNKVVIKMDFMTKAREIATRDGIPMTEAMSKATAEHPDEYNTLQIAGITTAEAIAKADAHRPTFTKRDEFMAKAREIACRDKIAPSLAMSKAASEYPELFEQMQAEGVGFEG